jgi:hypothetical protein
MTTAPVSYSVGFCGNFLIGSVVLSVRAGADMIKVKSPATCVEIAVLATPWCQAEKGSIASYKRQEW